MLRYSLEYPDVTFTLTGHGEETEDVWRKWYKDGIIVGEWEFEGFNIPSDPPKRVSEENHK